MPATQSSIILVNCIIVSINLFLQMTVEVQVLMVTHCFIQVRMWLQGLVESNIYSTIKCKKKKVIILGA